MRFGVANLPFAILIFAMTLTVQVGHAAEPGEDYLVQRIAQSCQWGASEECFLAAARHSEGDSARTAAILQKGCDTGNQAACVLLGHLYLNRKEGDEGFAVVAHMVRQQCDAGSDLNCLQAGSAFTAPGIGHDRARARLLYQQACDRGYLPGCSALGKLVAESDPPAADTLYRRACNGGDLGGCHQMGLMLADGGKLLDAVCQKGFMPACVSLANRVSSAHRQEPDFQRARGLFHHACDMSEPRGCYGLARYYRFAIGITQNLAKARTLFRQACHAGTPDACYQLGLMARLFDGPGRNYDDLRPGLTTACETGKMIDCYRLAFHYRDALGIPQDFIRARSLFARACDAGVQAACASLGQMVLRGQGARSDVVTARQILAKACKAGENNACILDVMAGQDVTTFQKRKD